MFYPHNLQESRQRRDYFHKQAEIKHGEGMSAAWFAEYNLLQLNHIAEFGLPDCYKSFKDFLYDFWADFSYDMVDRFVSINLMLGDERWANIQNQIKEKFDYDISSELVNALVDITPYVCKPTPILRISIELKENDAKALGRHLRGEGYGNIGMIPSSEEGCAILSLPFIEEDESDQQMASDLLDEVKSWCLTPKLVEQLKGR